MKNDSLFLRSTLLVLLTILCACQKEPEVNVETQEDSLLELFSGTSMGYRDGPLLEAQFQYPTFIAAAPDKSLYIVEYTGIYPSRAIEGGSRVRKISPDGLVSTFYDLNTTVSDENIIRGIAVDKNGAVFISAGNQIKTISSNAQIMVVAGDGSIDTMRDGAALSASFWEPQGLAFDKNGCLYIMDTKNNAVRILTGGKVTTLAGGNRNFIPQSALSDIPRDGIGRQAEFDYPKFISVDNKGNAYVVGGFFPIVRKITSKGEVTAIPKGTLFFDEDHINTLYGITVPHNGILYYTGFFHDAPGDTFRFHIGSRTSTGEEITFIEVAEYDVAIDGYIDVHGFPNASEHGLNFPTGTVIVDNTLYICNTGEHRIRTLNLD